MENIQNKEKKATAESGFFVYLFFLVAVLFFVVVFCLQLMRVNHDSFWNKAEVVLHVILKKMLAYAVLSGGLGPESQCLFKVKGD